MKQFAVDLHIHTALSPCADDTMTPPDIVGAAFRKGLDMIAICDHNAAGNAAAVQAAAQQAAAQQAAAQQTAVTVIAGIEITTEEEVHVLGLFPDAATARAAADEVRATLPPWTPKARRFGNQLLMDARGKVVGRDKKLLSTASGLELHETVDLIKRHGGLAIASHIDRPSFSVMSQLGLFPSDVAFDAIEISAAGLQDSRDAEFASLGLPMVTASDSHFLTEIGATRTFMTMEAPIFDELAPALNGVDGRSCGFA